MASSFVVGDKFRNRVTELLENQDVSLPQGLKEELRRFLENPELTLMSFSTARELKKHIEARGELNPRSS